MVKNSNAMFLQLSYGKRLMLLALMFLVMGIFASFAASFAKQIFDADTREYMLLASALQAIIMFVAPAIGTAYFLSPMPIKMLGLNKGVSVMNVVGIILVMIVAMPALNQVIAWNSQLSFPDFLSDLEVWMREMETNAAQMQNLLLSSNTIGGFVMSLSVVAVLTGFAEEIFFRGALQRVLASNGTNHHVAIWVAAFVFSLLHFQFFGFFPRLLLGAFFGYIFYWTGSIWASAIAHAINNGIVVVSIFLINRGCDINAIEHLGVQDSGFPMIACISAGITILILAFFRKKFFATTRR